MMYRIIPGLLDAAAVKALTTIVCDAEFVDGRITAPTVSRETKRNQELTPGDADARRMGAILGEALRRNKTFVDFTIPQRYHSPPTISRYKTGMYFHRHLDNAVIGVAPKVRTDFSMTIFLSAPETYDGGELILELEGGDKAIKLESGSAVVYDTGAYHRVSEVTRGERVVVVTWVQSFIGDPRQRQIMRDLSEALRRSREMSAGSELVDLLHASTVNLYRMWADV